MEAAENGNSDSGYKLFVFARRRSVIVGGIDE